MFPYYHHFSRTYMVRSIPTEMGSVDCPEGVIASPPPGTRYLSHGFAAHLYVTLDCEFVIKRPKVFVGYDDSWNIFRRLVDNERKIYERLGVHDGVIGYHGYDETSGSIQLVCASDGDLTDFINHSPKPHRKIRFKMMRHISDTLLYIYSRNVAVQDIKTDNVLMHYGMPKFCDFTQGILYPLAEKIQDVCPPRRITQGSSWDGLCSLFHIYLGGLQLRFLRERALAHFGRPEADGKCQVREDYRKLLARKVWFD